MDRINIQKIRIDVNWCEAVFLAGSVHSKHGWSCSFRTPKGGPWLDVVQTLSCEVIIGNRSD